MYEEDSAAQRDPVYWSTNDSEERLIWAEQEDAVLSALDGMMPGENPDSITVYGWATMAPQVNTLTGSRVLDVVLEDLCEENGAPGSDSASVERTAEMVAAADEFVDRIAKLCPNYWHEVVCTELVPRPDGGWDSY